MQFQVPKICLLDVRIEQWISEAAERNRFLSFFDRFQLNKPSLIVLSQDTTSQYGAQFQSIPALIRHDELCQLCQPFPSGLQSIIAFILIRPPLKIAECFSLRSHPNPWISNPCEADTFAVNRAFDMRETV
jgi:hypothetical protein